MNRSLHGWKEFSWRLLAEDISKYLGNFISNLTRYLIDTVEHLIVACILYIIICITLYICIVRKKYITFNRETRNAKRILFVIAHPDDECMFFGPTILNYTKKKSCEVYLMCLTTGLYRFKQWILELEIQSWFRTICRSELWYGFDEEKRIVQIM